MDSPEEGQRPPTAGGQATAGASTRVSDYWYAPDSGAVPYRPVNSRPRRPRKAGVMLIGIVAVAVIVAGSAFIAFGAGQSRLTAGYRPAGGSPGQDAKEITSVFLQAWQSGNLEQAARYTDHPAAARTALLAYRKYLRPKKLTAAAGTAAAVTAASGSTASGSTASGAGAPAGARESVTFEVDATVSAGTGSAGDGAKTVDGVWRYHSSLVAYQQGNSAVWFIAWAPDVLAPNLTAGTHLAAVSVPPQVISVTDSAGNDLASYGDAGLKTIAGKLSQSDPAGGKGSPGLSVEVRTAAGKPVPGLRAAVVSPGEIPALATTISARAEKAARKAVGAHKDSSMAVIQPSTGKILAIANNNGENDFALTARVAPGSTGKIVAATALLADGVLTADTPVSCPVAYNVQGVTYHNDGGESEPASTPMAEDFAQSCNNAFSQWWRRLENGRLADAAKKYYGLNQPWDIGIGESATFYQTPPDATGSEVAQEAFGEGAISAAPLAIASVAATVDTGSFRQPLLVPGARQVTAAPLPAGTDTGLKKMMRAVVTTGTAAGLRLGPGVYAKTGTSDVDGQGQPNSWFVAFAPGKDVAVACLVLNAGFGAQVAGPEARSFLNDY